MSDKSLAFQSVGKVIGQNTYDFMTSKILLVVGLGGVGSWAVESLARSGFRKLVLMDLDDICVSNTNRQIHTLQSTVGKSKVEVLKERVLAINPACEVEAVADFLHKDNVRSYLEKYQPDMILDGIDSLGVKCALAATAREMKIPLLVSGSAGGKLLASELKVSDLATTYEDDLLHQMRKRLRQKHGFPRGKRKFKITCVFSAEPKTVCEVPKGESSGRLDCQTGLGSLCHVTASMGMLLTQQVILHFMKELEE